MHDFVGRTARPSALLRYRIRQSSKIRSRVRVRVKMISDRRELPVRLPIVATASSSISTIHPCVRTQRRTLVDRHRRAGSTALSAATHYLAFV